MPGGGLTASATVGAVKTPPAELDISQAYPGAGRQSRGAIGPRSGYARWSVIRHRRAIRCPRIMLAVVLFLSFWVVLAMTLVFIAVRGGPRGARHALQSQSRGSRKAASVVFVIVYVGFGIALPVLFLSGNHARASARVGEVKLSAANKRGRDLFGLNCGVCHTLAAANAVGKVGPNLDSLRPPRSLVLHTIQYGCVQNPPANDPTACLGFGTMPAAIVQGRDAADVASFVAKVAGR